MLKSLSGPNCGDESFCHDLVVTVVMGVVPIGHHATPRSARLPPVIRRIREFPENSACFIPIVERLETVGNEGTCIFD